ncbi:MAG: InlB B-repeat-containing protein [Nitrososphaerota archaeon]|nr:InlB B-repeat-containing protein [Nitrososphaerota archaeon]
MKNKTQKSIYSIAIMLALVVSCFAVLATTSASAEAGGRNIYLKGEGSNFKEQWNNVFYLTAGENGICDFTNNPLEADVGSNPNVWHLVYTGNEFDAVCLMQLTFTNGERFLWFDDMGPSTNGGGNNLGWVIVAPADWKIDYVNKGNDNESGSFVYTNESGNINFNISGFHKGTPDGTEPTTYTVTYDENGGDGIGCAIPVEDGAVHVVFDAEEGGAGEKEYYMFAGWTIAEDETGTIYNAGDELTVTEDITLVAVWERLEITLDEYTYEQLIVLSNNHVQKDTTVTLTFAVSDGTEIVIEVPTGDLTWNSNGDSVINTVIFTELLVGYDVTVEISLTVVGSNTNYAQITGIAATFDADDIIS